MTYKPRQAAPFFITPPAGGRLRGLAWSAADDNAQAPLVLVLPGRSEPIEKYQETILALTQTGSPVWAVDWRGQGLSPRATDPLLSRRGHIDRFEDWISDLTAILDYRQQQAPQRRLIILAHSMGAAITLRWLQSCAPTHSALTPHAVVLSGPMTSLPTWGHPRWLVRWLAHSAARCGLGRRYVLGEHGWGLKNDCVFDNNRRTSCPQRFAREITLLRGRPDLRVGGPTWQWLEQAFRLTAALRKPWPASALNIPLTVLVGSEDAYVPLAQQQAFFMPFPAAKVIPIPAARHEIFMEQDPPRQMALDIVRRVLTQL